MEQISVREFGELHCVLEQIRSEARPGETWVFRGQARSEWELLSKAGRLGLEKDRDVRLFRSWQRRAVEYVRSMPQDDWDWLLLAQHHGLITRLLDWSYRPLIAAFFACSEGDGDAAIFAYRTIIHAHSDRLLDPFSLDGIHAVQPRRSTRRIGRQSALVTLHSPPDLPINEATVESGALKKLVLPARCISKLRDDLSFYGVNRETLFPDLDGLSAHINWRGTA